MAHTTCMIDRALAYTNAFNNHHDEKLTVYQGLVMMNYQKANNTDK